MNRTTYLARLASMMNLTAKEAIWLPASIDNCAAKVGMDDLRFIGECFNNQPLRDYIANTIRTLAA